MSRCGGSDSECLNGSHRSVSYVTRLLFQALSLSKPTDLQWSHLSLSYSAPNERFLLSITHLNMDGELAPADQYVQNEIHYLPLRLPYSTFPFGFSISVHYIATYLPSLLIWKLQNHMCGEWFCTAHLERILFIQWSLWMGPMLCSAQGVQLNMATFPTACSIISVFTNSLTFSKRAGVGGSVDNSQIIKGSHLNIHATLSWLYLQLVSMGLFLSMDCYVWKL